MHPLYIVATVLAARAPLPQSVAWGLGHGAWRLESPAHRNSYIFRVDEGADGSPGVCVQSVESPLRHAAAAAGTSRGTPFDSPPPASTLAQLANGEVAISSPEHGDSYMVRVDVTASKEHPGICSGDQFCCQPAAADRAWYLIDGESAGPSHDAWFQPLAQAAEFHSAVCASRSVSGRR